MALDKGREWPVNRRALLADVQLFLKEHEGSDEELTQSFRKIFRPEVDFAKLKERSTKDSLLKIVEILLDDAILVNWGDDWPEARGNLCHLL